MTSGRQAGLGPGVTHPGGDSREGPARPGRLGSKMGRKGVAGSNQSESIVNQLGLAYSF